MQIDERRGDNQVVYRCIPDPRDLVAGRLISYFWDEQDHILGDASYQKA